jgi:ABC-type transporter Mla subunit MlaD
MKTVQDSYAQSAARAARNGDQATANAIEARIERMKQLRKEYDSLRDTEREYMSLRAKAAQLSQQGDLSPADADELRRTNEQIAQMKPQFESIAADLREASQYSANLGDAMSDGVAGGSKKAADNVENIKDDTKEANKQAGLLARTWERISSAKGEFIAGMSLGVVFSEMNAIADKAIETYYSYGQMLDHTGYGTRSLIVDTWNLAKMQTRLNLSAARMNMPIEAANEAYTKLSQTVRNIYGKNGKIRTDIATDAIENILAFSRVTGASVDQATELYARFINQFGKSHKQAKEGLNVIARSGQLVNETLEEMGVNGSIFLNDLTGVLNDAAQAFDGFTLNVDHLSARVAHAVKVGKELGMTYNQSMDVAKQMTGIFAKPGGYLGFQAGEQLRQELQQLLAGVSDAEERARIISSHYKVSTSTARTLDIARNDVNAQMQVMEIMKGTDAGMQKQYDLMRGIAKGNAQSLEVFKQFVGGENLSPEQSGDLLQVLQNGGSFEEFKLALGATKDKTNASSVIDQSIMAPTMVKEIMKAIATSPEYHTFGLVIVGMWKFMQKLTKITVLIGTLGLLYKVFQGMPKVFDNIKAAMAGPMDRFSTWAESKLAAPMAAVSEKLTPLREYATEGRAVMTQFWRHVRSGAVLDRLGQWLKISKEYLGNIMRSSFDIRALFRSGAARVQMLGGAAAARANAAYQRMSGSFKDKYAGVDLSIAKNARDSLSRAAGRIGSVTGTARAGIMGVAEAAQAQIAGMTGMGGVGGFGAGAAGGAPMIDEAMAAGELGEETAGSVPAGKGSRLSARARLARMRARRGAKAAPGRFSKLFGRGRAGLKRAGEIGGPVLKPLGKIGFLNSFLGRTALMSVFMTAGLGAMGAIDAGMTNEENPDEEDVDTAGTRKFGEDISKRQQGLGELGEALAAARATGDRALIDALESEAKAKQEELKSIEDQKSAFDAKDKAYKQKLTMIQAVKDRMKRLKKLDRPQEEIDAQQKLLDRLENEAGQDKDWLNKRGADTTVDNKKWAGLGGMLIKGQGLMHGALALLRLPMLSGIWANFVGAIAGIKAKLSAGFARAMGMAKRFPFAQKAIAKVAAKSAKMIGKFVPGIGDVIQGVTDGLATEGSIGKKLFVGAASAGGSFIGRTLTLAAAAGLGIGTGGFGAGGSLMLGLASHGVAMGSAKAAGYGASKAWERWVGPALGEEVQTVDPVSPDNVVLPNAPVPGAVVMTPGAMPTSSGAVTAAGPQSTTARGRIQDDSAGNSRMVIEISNSNQWLDGKLMRLSSDRSGYAGKV